MTLSTAQLREGKIRFLGRTYPADYTLWSGGGIRKDVECFDWTASGFVFSFRGTGVSAQLLTNRYDQSPIFLYVFVDGETSPDRAKMLRLEGEEEAWYSLAEGLPEGEHQICVRRASACCRGSFGDPRSLAGVTALEALRVEGEAPALLPPPAEKSRRLEFVGDSITCGDANNRVGELVIEDGLRTYAAHTARALDAEWNVMAISGNGVICSVLGNPLLELPDQYLFSDKLSGNGVEWDFSRYQPDVVVVNLGTNDRAGVPGKFSYEEFKNGVTRAFAPGDPVVHHTGVKEFLQMIHAHAPAAKILWLFGAMGEGLTDALRESVAEFNAQQGEEIAYFQLLQDSGEIPDGKANDNNHPSEAASKVYADAIGRTIRAIMHW